MKLYTDLEQSKKLVEILPLESADMAWCNNSIKGVNYTDKFSANLYTVKEMQDVFNEALHGWDKYWELIPCWSLAALLDVLPNFIGDYGKCLYYDVGGYYCVYMVDGDFMLTIEETNADNPIDACYEMIIKLHELKML